MIQSKDVEWDAIGITEVGEKEFGLFLKAMKGLSMKDVFVYVLKKVYTVSVLEEVENWRCWCSF